MEIKSSQNDKILEKIEYQIEKDRDETTQRLSKNKDRRKALIPQNGSYETKKIVRKYKSTQKDNTLEKVEDYVERDWNTTTKRLSKNKEKRGNIVELKKSSEGNDYRNSSELISLISQLESKSKTQKYLSQTENKYKQAKNMIIVIIMIIIIIAALK